MSCRSAAQYSELLEKVMSSWHGGLASCCVSTVFGVAVPIGGAKMLRWCLPGMRVWQLAVCKLCWG